MMRSQLFFNPRHAASVVGLGAVALAFVFSVNAHAGARGLQQSAPHGKIAPWEAMRIGAARASGRPLQATFEFEDHKWIYSVVVVSGKTLHEVEIDAITGKVSDSEEITPAGEGRELTHDLSVAIGAQSRRKASARPGGEEKE